MNRLGLEKSPYLLQHASNPVHWFPWCAEAFEKAKAENKLVFLSVGYSTCHWCHVMEHESFANIAIAAILNKYYVAVKVDREERPEIDRLYMRFVQLFTGRGGWPMSVWLTPDRRPIFGGTYFPPWDSGYHKGFTTILTKLAYKWQRDPGSFLETVEKNAEAIRKSFEMSTASDSEFDRTDAEDCQAGCFSQLSTKCDRELGGFGRAPKFPSPGNLRFLLRYAACEKPSKSPPDSAEMSLLQLAMMARGGIHDHLAGGFHRYATDDRWHVPHFEKMLYDQSQVAMLYLEAVQYLRRYPELEKNVVLFERVARGTLEYMTSNLLHRNSGGFFSAEDADSLPTPESTKKSEGAFAVWRHAEVKEVLGEDEQEFNVLSRHLGVHSDGNVDASLDARGELSQENVLFIEETVMRLAASLDMSIEGVETILEKAKAKLMARRHSRPPPSLDDKIVTSWNGLAIASFAFAGEVLGDEEYIKTAVRCGEFVRSSLYNNSSGELVHVAYRNTQTEEVTSSLGETSLSAVAHDYVCVIRGLLYLFQATGDFQWLDWAIRLQATLDSRFFDASTHTYRDRIEDAGEMMILSICEEQDGAEPCANSVAVDNLLWLQAILSDGSYQEQAQQILKAFHKNLTRIPVSLPEMIAATLRLTARPETIILLGNNSAKLKAMREEVSRWFLPHKVIITLGTSNEEASTVSARIWGTRHYLKDIDAANTEAVAFLCVGQSCLSPAYSPSELRERINDTISSNV